MNQLDRYVGYLLYVDMEKNKKVECKIIIVSYLKIQ